MTGGSARRRPEPDWTVAASPDQVSTDAGDEVVILNLADESYYGLDGVGTLVWELLREPRTVADLRDAITAEYEVDADAAERDLAELLAEMAERGLVRLTPPGAARG